MYYVNTYYKSDLLTSLQFDNRTEAINHFNYVINNVTKDFNVEILNDNTVLFSTEV